MLPKIMRRPTHSVMIAVALAGISACSDPVDSSKRPDVALAYMQLTVQPGHPTVAILGNGQAMWISVPEGTGSINIAADWLNAAREFVPDAATTELEFTVSGAAFTKVAGTRRGVVSGLTSGRNVVRISVFRPGNGQSVFVVELIVNVTAACDDSCGGWDY